jgi:dCMP deaminase
MVGAPSWDAYYVNMLPAVAARSKDPHTKVGAIIVSPDRRPISQGYNGFPSGILDCLPERYDRPEKYYWFVHAEANAIYSAARAGIRLDGSTIYVSFAPCMKCAVGIVQCGIKRVVVDRTNHESQDRSQWASDFERAHQLYEEANVTLDWYTQ